MTYYLFLVKLQMPFENEAPLEIKQIYLDIRRIFNAAELLIFVNFQPNWAPAIV